MPGPYTVFLLSPASSAGKRARLLVRDAASFPLATRLRNGGAPLGEVFTFLSGLYFRGKIAYAHAFARAPERSAGVFVITTSRGLVDPASTVTIADLNEFASVPIDVSSVRFRNALVETSGSLAAKLGKRSRVVLLGSIATDKYVEPLREVFGDRLLFPAAFIGRGDMSRGGLMLRCAEDRTELEYVRIDGAVRRGPRPPKLTPRRYS